MTRTQGYSQDIAVSEKVCLGRPDKTTRFGVPWNFMLRDVLQFDTTLDDVTNRMTAAHRTCDVIFGACARISNCLRRLRFLAKVLIPFQVPAVFRTAKCAFTTTARRSCSFSTTGTTLNTAGTRACRALCMSISMCR